MERESTKKRTRRVNKQEEKGEKTARSYFQVLYQVPGMVHRQNWSRESTALFLVVSKLEPQLL